MHPITATERLGILLLWAFDHKLIPVPQYVNRHCLPKVASRLTLTWCTTGSRQGQQIEGQQPAAKDSRWRGSSQPPRTVDRGAAASRLGQYIEGQQPAAKGSRSRGSSQPPRTVHRGAAASRHGQQIDG
jgi:hypothetical protein